MGEPAPARVTIIYRVLPSLIRPRTQGTPVFLMRESLLRGWDEGPESRLAEMDSDRKNRRCVYCVRDVQHGPGSPRSRRRVAPVAAPCRSVASFKEITMATRLKVLAVVAALAVGTSSPAMAQYAIPAPGYRSLGE